MGIFSKAKRTVGKIAKPFSKAASKFSQKFIPKEIRPFAAMATPFLPSLGIMGQLGGATGFSKMYLANLLGQQLADPDAEFGDLNQFAALLSGTQGGLTNTGTAQNLRDMTTKGSFRNLPAGGATMPELTDKILADRSLLTKAKDLGLEGLASASDYLTGTNKTLQDIGSGNIDLFSGPGAKEFAKAAAVPFSTGMGGVTEAYQRPLIREFEKDRAAEEAEIEATTTANESERADLQMTFMRQADIGEDKIKETLEMNDLGEYYTPPTESAANGGIMGRTGFRNGGIDQYKTEEEKYMDKLLATDSTIPTSPTDPRNMTTAEIVSAITSGMSTPEMFQELMLRNSGGVNEIDMDEGQAFSFNERGVTSDGAIENLLFKLRESNPDIYGEYSRPREFLPTAGPKFYRRENLPVKANGGIIGLKEGGMLNFGGREMDLRTGGFVPIGKKERADDVPARLSKNEFVMTADAVRAAGGGSVNKGAQRMYDVMNKLEARA